ncbi:hypothetical protein HA402_000933 [Bradysia odoriphaga]|nr:hypothetical protein HA402_000933 [Bradysia odoriphaga]
MFYHPDAKIIRSRDEKVLKDCDIVVDVGGQYDKSKNLFDHHQKSFVHTLSTLRPEYPNYDKVRLSSAGLIYTHFGEEVIREILKKKCDLTVHDNLLGKIFEKVYQGLIQEIDGIDNGVPMFDGEPKYRITSDISSRVGRYNPDWNTTENVDVQQQFEKAMVIAGEEFLDRKELVGVAKYVLFCSGRDDYRVIAVPNEPGSFNLRKALHKDWQGVRDADLQKISGIEGAVFVHATGFIGGNKTMKGALEMAIKSLEADE